MTGRQPDSRAAATPKPGILVWLAAVSLACTLEAVPASAQQTTSQGGSAPQDKSQPNKDQADKAKKDAAAAKPAAPSSSRSVYSVGSGTNTYYRAPEPDRKPTKDDKVETQRGGESHGPPYGWLPDAPRMLVNYGGGLMEMPVVPLNAEKEVHTKNLPDGTVETEYVTTTTDGAGHKVPTEIIRERTKKSGDKTTIQRERLNPDGDGHWNTVRKEQVTETGPDAARKSVKEVLLPDVEGRWQVVDKETTTSKATKDAEQSHTVHQVPDANGRLSDFEVKDETTTTKGNQQTHQVNLSRRDFQEADRPDLRPVEKTTEVKTTSADGKQVTTKTTTESNMLDGGTVPDVNSSHMRVVQESTEVDTKGPNGEKKVLDVKQRDAGDPSKVRPGYKVVTETDKDGKVRQVFIPADR